MYLDIKYLIHMQLALTFLLLIASSRRATTSSPITPLQLKPLVHLTKWPSVNPCWVRGKLKVKPNGSTSFCKFRSFTNNAKHCAM